jgi:predicted ester cyclase
MSTEENKAMVRRFAREVVNGGDFGLFDELVAPDCVEHTGPHGAPPTRATLRSLIEGFRAAFPDLETTEEDIIAEGDRVVYLGTVRGTHRGDCMGIAPTGRCVTIGEIHIQRVVGGKMVEHWGQFDALGLLHQLGVLPVPAPSAAG